MKVTIYGASDDLVEVEGDLAEEFSCNDGGFLSFSDGTILFIEYRSDSGEWKISQMAVGAAEFSNRVPTGDEYSDHATLTGDFRWMLFTEKPENGQRIFVKAKRGSV